MSCSIEVKEGDQVKQGDLLGLVGNSGNSSEPHMHFHIADSMNPMKSKVLEYHLVKKVMLPREILWNRLRETLLNQF